MAEAWWPLDNLTISGDWGNSPAYYGQFGQLGHNGIDFPVPIGTPVYAAADGVVLLEGWNIPWSGAVGGIACILRHGWGHSGYAHLSTTLVDVGQRVAQGQLIGYSGNTGGTTGPHLHYECLPLLPNFGNGYSGRVNPRAIAQHTPRGASAPEGDDDMFTDIDRQRLDASYAALFGPRNLTGTDVPLSWLNIGGEKQTANYGILPIVIHNQTLIAQNAAALSGKIDGLAEALKQLASGGGKVDMGAISEAAERGAREALAGLVLRADE